MTKSTEDFLAEVQDLVAELRAENKKAKEALGFADEEVFTTEIPYPNKEEGTMLKAVTYKDGTTDIVYSPRFLGHFRKYSDYVEYLRNSVDKIYKNK